MPETIPRWHEWLAHAVDFLFPALCAGCGRYTEEPHGVCPKCAVAVQEFTEPWCLNCLLPLEATGACSRCGNDTVPVFALADYSGVVQEIIKEVKFRGVRAPMPYFAARLAERFGERLRQRKADALVPVPLHPAREYRRGFNQALLLAESLSRSLGLPVWADIVVRRAGRKPQSKLRDPSARARNIHGAFEVISPAESSCRVLVVDDVVTSGATVREVAAVLEPAGYRMVGAAVVAHGA